MAWLRAAAQGMGLFCCRALGRGPKDSARTRLKCSTMLGEGDVAPDSSCGHRLGQHLGAAALGLLGLTAGGKAWRSQEGRAPAEGSVQPQKASLAGRGHSAAKGPPPQAQLSPDCQIQQGPGVPRTAGGF